MKITKVFIAVGSDIHPSDYVKMTTMRNTIAGKLGLTEDDVFVFEHTAKVVVRLEDGEFVEIF